MSFAGRLEDVPYVDHPELRIDEHESTEMPFRYVKGEDGLPVMPKVRKPENLWWFYFASVSHNLGFSN